MWSVMKASVLFLVTAALSPGIDWSQAFEKIGQTLEIILTIPHSVTLHC